MADLTTRSGKGSPLTNAEVDANFTNLNTDKVETGLAALDAYDTTIADTAVDVFVYDTSRDSDGGAWRKRTQHTSWYNETLNTATRGSRREFPAVAVIVATSTTVTIYDGDDPSLPMWMVFPDSAPGIRGMNAGSSVKAVTMQNGFLASATSGASNEYQSGLALVNFLSDRFSLIRGAALGERIVGTIEERGSGTATAGDDSIRLASGYCNDVAMTVLPNAPIDAATGLPVPTIAVATGGGVSVIKDDGTVVDITWTGGASYHDIAITDTYKIIVGVDFSGAAGGRYVKVYDIPSSDMAEGSYGSQGSALANYTTSSVIQLNANPTDDTYYHPRQYIGVNDTLHTILAAGYQYTWAGLSNVHGYENQDTALLSQITSSYNTGWMNGDIKLATLSDTDDTNITGSELVTNGTFDTDLTGWSVNADTSWDASGRLKYEVTSGPTGVTYPITEGITLEANTPYVLTLEVEKFNNVFTNAIIVLNGTQGNSGTDILPSTVSISSTTPGSPRAYTVYFETSGDTSYFLQVLVNGIPTGEGFYLDNVSIRKVVPDRSINGNGLAVYGTITKSPVATGADLVAYSGFSTSNHLQQPHNSDLNFGTGDFSYMFWVKGSASANETIIDHSGSSNGVGNPRLRIHGFNASTGIIRVYITDGSVTNLELSSSAAVLNDVWNCVCVVRNSGTVSIYVNGKLDVSNGYAGNLTRTAGQLSVGLDGDNTDPLANGYLALLRISATAPTAEQIKKIYEDEKVLFQEGAQATLYGSSDAVTALAHDPVTDLLHVGTSAGRSVFQGLRRVDNTTDAVGTAISAVDSLVVEE